MVAWGSTCPRIRSFTIGVRGENTLDGNGHDRWPTQKRQIAGAWRIAMRQVILTMLMAVVSSSAFAEWVAIGSTDKFSAYVDAATIRQAGNKIGRAHV